MQLQEQRFERKYIVSEEQARQILEWVRHFLVPDEFTEKSPTGSYPVHSIYLDSDELATYWATVHCEKSRFKLRLRFYDDDPASPVFMEIKRRFKECIFKRRVGVRKDRVAGLLDGQSAEAADFFNFQPKGYDVVRRFCELMRQLRATPKVHVAYDREAWSSAENNSVRVTLDRCVTGAMVSNVKLQTALHQSYRSFENQVILELKYTNIFPEWFRDLTRFFKLVQFGAPKYCSSIEGLGGEGLMRAEARTGVHHFNG